MYFATIPILLTFCIAIYPIIIWIIAIHMKHVEPILPYISDASSQSPEASIASHLINFISILIFLFVYIRYRNMRRINEISSRNENNIINELNGYSLMCGFMYGISLTLIANYRPSEIRTVHSIGFVLLIAFIVIDIHFQYKIAFINGNNGIGKKRAVIAIALVICFVLFIIFGHISMKRIGSQLFFDDEFRRNWNWSQNGFAYHVISVLFEWIIVILIALYTTTFIYEFKTFSFRANKFPYVREV